MSELFRLDWRDFTNGLFVSFLGALLPIVNNYLQLLIDGGDLLNAPIFDYKYAFTAAWAAGLAYLGKRFLSNELGDLFVKLK